MGIDPTKIKKLERMSKQKIWRKRSTAWWAREAGVSWAIAAAFRVRLGIEDETRETQNGRKYPTKLHHRKLSRYASASRR